MHHTRVCEGRFRDERVVKGELVKRMRGWIDYRMDFSVGQWNRRSSECSRNNGPSLFMVPTQKAASQEPKKDL